MIAWIELIGLACLTFASGWLAHRYAQQHRRRHNLDIGAPLSKRERHGMAAYDALLQSVQGLAMMVSAAANELPEDHQARILLGRALRIARAVVDEGRDALHQQDEMPEVDEDFARLIGTLGKRLEDSNGTPFALFLPPKIPCIERSDQLVAIVRAALINAYRHAQATTVVCKVEVQDVSLLITVIDDGVGFDPSILDGPPLTHLGHFGLHGMKERARRCGAQLSVKSANGEGTSVSIHFPLRE